VQSKEYIPKSFNAMQSHLVALDVFDA